ncbi:phosphatase PAP2 family protein [Arthrobacter celericrescens]|uniref:phosphatase PAP2 family protein n=1 Tax=Arthrobacter celericrescens TaxID=2320851 RepID=UPI000EA27A07|nr:phosphatase PAP2 family protein [Arthrobacter celericrescens]
MHLALRERARHTSVPPPAPRCSQRTLFFWAAGLLLAGDALFWTVYAQVQTNSGLVLLDGPVHDFLLGIRSPALTTLLGAVSAATSPLAMSVICVGFCVAWWIRLRELWRPVLLLCAMGFTVVVTAVVKEWVGRPRPPARDFLFGPDDALSFPSGHTTGVTVFLFVLAYFLASRSGQRSTAVLAPAVALAGTLVVALSRIYLGYHWVSDVVASIGLGLAVTAVAVFADAVRRGPDRATSVPGAAISGAARRSV